MADITTVTNKVYNYFMSITTKWADAISQVVTMISTQILLDSITLYVDKVNGSDSEICVGSEEYPLRTISKAIDRGKRARTINIILKNNYLVSFDEDFRNHPNVIIDLQGYQLQFRKKILRLKEFGGNIISLPTWNASNNDVTNLGLGTGMYGFDNVSGLRINCTGSNIILPYCYFGDEINLLPNFIGDVYVGKMIREGLYNSITAIRIGLLQDMSSENSHMCYFYADETNPAQNKPGCRVLVVDDGMQPSTYGVTLLLSYKPAFLYSHMNYGNTTYLDYKTLKFNSKGCIYNKTLENNITTYVTEPSYTITVNNVTTGYRLVTADTTSYFQGWFTDTQYNVWKALPANIDKTYEEFIYENVFNRFPLVINLENIPEQL
jgi:hypothetical protein